MAASRCGWIRRLPSARSEAGVAVGLAWTPAGGDVLFIEANRMKGKGGFTMTGQIGEVMQESHAGRADLGPLERHVSSGWRRTSPREMDLHIHVPAGAIPKDGPSAGVTMATALVSLLTDTADSSADRDDRRDHAERQCAAGGRHQGEVPGGQARGRHAT